MSFPPNLTFISNGQLVRKRDSGRSDSMKRRVLGGLQEDDYHAGDQPDGMPDQNSEDWILRQCPLLAISGHAEGYAKTSALPPKADIQTAKFRQ